MQQSDPFSLALTRTASESDIVVPKHISLALDDSMVSLMYLRLELKRRAMDL